MTKKAASTTCDCVLLETRYMLPYTLDIPSSDVCVSYVPLMNVYTVEYK